MSNEKQVEQLTTYMANFIAHIAKNYRMMSIAKLTELRDKEDSPLSKQSMIQCSEIRSLR